MGGKFDRRLFVGIVVLAILVVVNAGISFWNTRNVRDDSNWIAHSQEVLAALDNLLSNLHALESAQLNFVLSGEERSFESFQHAETDIRHAVVRLRDLTADNSAQQERMGRLEAAIQLAANQLRLALSVRREQGLELARQFTLSGSGHRRLANVVQVVAELQQEERRLLAKRNIDTERVFGRATLFGIASAALSLVAVAAFVGLLRYSAAAAAKSDAAIHEQREWFRTTLGSIGDAVIACDTQGNVAFLNSVAESLTGWTNAAAAGRPLADVFHIVNQTTRAPVENPAMRALQEGLVVGLANHTVLISRTGQEIPIDDSAAPIRDETGNVRGAVLVFRDITERNLAETDRMRLAAIVESSDDAIVSKSLDGIIRTWNKGAERIFGYTPEEAIGRPITIIIPPDRIAEEKAIIQRIVHGERIDHYETVRVAKDGRSLDISLTISPLRNSEGEIIGASKIARDITARHLAENALRASENRLMFLAELTIATQPLVDPDAIMLAVARLLAEHLNVERCAYAEVEKESTFVITGDHTRGVRSIVGRWPVASFGSECLRQMLANEPFVVNDVNSDTRINAESRAAFDATDIQAVICVPLHKNQQFTAAFAVHQSTPRQWKTDEVELVQTVAGRCWEALERARVTRDLREAEERFRLMIESATDFAIFSLDLDGRIATWNSGAERVFGWSEEEIIGQHGAITFTPEDRANGIPEYEINKARAEGRAEDERWHIRKDGTQIFVSGVMVALREGRLKGYAKVCRDITERKLAEEVLRDADRRKDEFIALLAHELRNPLAPLRNGLQVMRLAPGDSAAVARSREMMDRQLSHMVRLIDDLLDASRISRNKMELRLQRVVLADVITSAIETARPAIEAAGHELIVHLPAEPLWLDADLTRLAQVFGNLVGNSAKYTEPGGKIWIDAVVENDQLVVAVRDTGIGIPAEELPHVFEMFSQVDRSIQRSSGGLGIGLALVKGLVDMHGGSVLAHSEGVGKGSTFTVRLPLPKQNGADQTTPTFAAPTTLTRHQRILVVDDNRDSAVSMEIMLRILGYDVLTAHDGEAALESARTFRPHVVLMDVGMPRLDGYNATRKLREEPWGQDVVVIALTGWGQDVDRAKSKEAGCDGHLVKPVNLPDLERLLAELTSRQKR